MTCVAGLPVKTVPLPPECTEAAERLDFQDVQGFQRLYIDMVCQDLDDLVSIIDYKIQPSGRQRRVPIRNKL